MAHRPNQFYLILSPSYDGAEAPRQNARDSLEISRERETDRNPFFLLSLSLSLFLSPFLARKKFSRRESRPTENEGKKREKEESAITFFHCFRRSFPPLLLLTMRRRSARRLMNNISNVKMIERIKILGKSPFNVTSLVRPESIFFGSDPKYFELFL